MRPTPHATPTCTAADTTPCCAGSPPLRGTMSWRSAMLRPEFSLFLGPSSICVPQFGAVLLNWSSGVRAFAGCGSAAVCALRVVDRKASNHCAAEAQHTQQRCDAPGQDQRGREVAVDVALSHTHACVGCPAALSSCVFATRAQSQRGRCACASGNACLTSSHCHSKAATLVVQLHNHGSLHGRSPCQTSQHPNSIQDIPPKRDFSR